MLESFMTLFHMYSNEPLREKIFLLHTSLELRTKHKLHWNIRDKYFFPTRHVYSNKYEIVFF